MIRLIGKRLIIPRGDTGAFSIPTKGGVSEGDIAVFGIFDPLTNKSVMMKIVPATEPNLTIPFVTEDTIELKPRKYNWDISIYKNPYYDEDGELIGAQEIHSYYSAFKLPTCEITEVALDVCKERWKTRDLISHTQIATGGYFSSIVSVYPWEQIQNTQLEEQLYEIAKSNGFEGSIEEFCENYAKIFAGGTVVKIPLSQFPAPGNELNLYLDTEGGTLYYYKTVSELNMELVNCVGAQVAGRSEDNDYYLYIPVKAVPIENLILRCGDSTQND